MWSKCCKFEQLGWGDAAAEETTLMLCRNCQRLWRSRGTLFSGSEVVRRFLPVSQPAPTHYSTKKRGAARGRGRSNWSCALQRGKVWTTIQVAHWLSGQSSALNSGRRGSGKGDSTLYTPIAALFLRSFLRSEAFSCWQWAIMSGWAGLWSSGSSILPAVGWSLTLHVATFGIELTLARWSLSLLSKGFQLIHLCPGCPGRTWSWTGFTV